MNCSYNSGSGIINCIENFTTSEEINNFDSDGYTKFQDTANLVGYILDSDVFRNSDKNVQIMAFIDDQIRSKKTINTDIRKVPVNDMIDEELHDKHVFYMTIYGNSDDTNKEIKLKIKYNNNVFELSSDKDLLFRKNNRFGSNLLKPVRFTVIPNVQDDTNNMEEVNNQVENIDNNQEETQVNNVVNEEIQPVVLRDRDSESVIKQSVTSEDSSSTEVQLTEDLKSCLSSFLECNEESDIMQAKCLDEFLKCNKEGTMDQCAEEFVSCNKV